MSANILSSTGFAYLSSVLEKFPFHSEHLHEFLMENSAVRILVWNFVGLTPIQFFEGLLVVPDIAMYVNIIFIKYGNKVSLKISLLIGNVKSTVKITALHVFKLKQQEI